jgi:hypothetical protein
MILLFGALALFGCQEDDSIAPEEISTTISYDTSYMFGYPTGYSYDGSRVVVHSVNGQIMKRVGGFRPVDGGSYLFGTEYYDAISYSGNRILVEKGKLSNYPSDPVDKTAFLVDAQGRITHKIDVREPGYESPRDTLKYQYDSQGLLIGTQRKIFSELYENAVYYYNARKNLDSIVWREIYQGNQLQKTIVEKFSNYDSAPNPLRKLFIFDETFLRSLSVNNFMKYERWVIQNANSNQTYYDQRVWNIPHDANGNIIF